MKINLLAILIITTLIFAEDSNEYRLRKNSFHIGAIGGKSYGDTSSTPYYGGTFSYDRFVGDGLFTIGSKLSIVRGGDIIGNSLRVNLIRVGFHPIYIPDGNSDKRIFVDPYILWEPLNNNRYFDDANPFSGTSDGMGFYGGTNINISKHFGAWIELGVSGHFNGSGGVSIVF